MAAWGIPLSELTTVTARAEIGQRITDEINADPEEVAALRRALKDAAMERRRSLNDVEFGQTLDRVMADHAELFRRLALGPGVEDTVLQERAIVAEAVEQAQAAERRRMALGALEEYIHNLREATDARALLERAKAAAYATPEVEWVTYTDEDLEALRRGEAAADAAVDDDFFAEDGPAEGDGAALTRGTGWCAPSP